MQRCGVVNVDDVGLLCKEKPNRLQRSCYPSAAEHLCAQTSFFGFGLLHTTAERENADAMTSISLSARKPENEPLHSSHAQARDQAEQRVGARTKHGASEKLGLPPYRYFSATRSLARSTASPFLSTSESGCVRAFL